MITIRNHATRRTRMNSHGERLADFCATNTCLTRAARIDFHDQPTSIFRFVGQHVYESRNGNIQKRLAQPTTSKPYNVQVFDRNQAILINQFPRFFVVEIPALVPDVVVKSLQQQCGFTSTIRTLISTCDTSLQASQLRLCGAEPARVVDLRSVAESSECAKPNVNADDVRIERQRVSLALNGEQSKPMSYLTFNCESFDFADNWSVEFNPEPTERINNNESS